MDETQEMKVNIKNEKSRLKSAQFQQHKELDVQESQIVAIRCFAYSNIKFYLYVFLSILTCGALNLVCYWYPFLLAVLMYKPCDPENSDVLCIFNQDGVKENIRVKNVQLEKECQVSSDVLQGNVKIFRYRFLYYYYDRSSSQFLPVYFNNHLKFNELQQITPLSSDQVLHYKKIYGKCQMKIKVPNIFILFVRECLSPFYILQLFAFILWIVEEYIAYALCIIVMTFLGCAINLYETRRNLIALSGMTLQIQQVKILRDNEWKVLPSSEIVPGDFVLIEEKKVTCDMIIKQGQAIVDESTLTGESFPVVKDGIPNTEQVYNMDGFKQHTLYEGTQILQTRGETIGIVIKTAFSTTKGKLIRGIIYPKPNNFTFDKDSFKFVIFMFFIALFGQVITIVFFVEQGVEVSEIVIICLDLIVITVPPALPMCMTVGTAFAIVRLKKKLITCISPPRVKVAGLISTFAFDKTGTLTQDGMEIVGIRSIDQKSELHQQMQEISELNKLLNDFDLQEQQASLSPNLQLKMLEGLAVCHSLNLIRGILIGDTLEIKMLQATGWKFETSQEDGKGIITPVLENKEFQQQIEVHRIFHFDSKLKRMGVIVKSVYENSLYYFFQKGACEAVSRNCSKNTIPNNLQYIYKSYTQVGYRVLALAFKPLQVCPDLQKIQLLEVENDLTFLGLLILNNPIKPETFDAITTLHQASIRTLISTGDDVLTAIAVARKCGIIEELDDVHVGELNQDGQLRWTVQQPITKMISPENTLKVISSISTNFIEPFQNIQDQMYFNTEEWNNIYQRQKEQKRSVKLAIVCDAFTHLLKGAKEGDQEKKRILNIFTREGKIFARMTPEGKTALISVIQDTKVLIGMCGDGANDCGALKQADVGISLSQADASIAAPFTSKIEHIGCTGVVLREGRCALVTSFQCFKFMALYGMIQFTSVVILYIIVSGLSDYQFLWIDIPHILPLSIFMGYQGPYSKLVTKMPIEALISYQILSSITGQVLLQILAQAVLVFAILPQQDWFEPIDVNSEDYIENYTCYENTTIFVYSNLIYLNVVFAFTEGKPFRHTTFKNYKLVVTFTLLYLMDLYILFIPMDWTTSVLKMKDIPYDWKGWIFLAIVMHLIVAVAFEKVWIPQSYKWFRSIFRRKNQIKGLVQ